METNPDIPLGHIVPSHRVHGWCLHCPDRSVAEELAAWQVDAMSRADEAEQLRTENERMRYELEVMYGGAFDSPSTTTGTPCGPLPDTCDAEAGDPCANHEREQAHGEGEHALCGPECAARHEPEATL